MTAAATSEEEHGVSESAARVDGLLEEAAGPQRWITLDPWTGDWERLAADLIADAGGTMRRLREAWGWSREELASALGVSVWTIGARERGASYDPLPLMLLWRKALLWEGAWGWREDDGALRAALASNGRTVIRKLLGRTPLTGVDLAREVGVSAALVYHWGNGTRDVLPEYHDAIMRVWHEHIVHI